MPTVISGTTGVNKVDPAATSDGLPVFQCRAWVNFNGTRNVDDTGASTNGQPVFIRASGNVTSVVKNGTGDYTVNFTTAMPDANYSVVATTRNYNMSLSGADVITTTAVNLKSWYASSTVGGRTDIDSYYNFVAIFR
jgi:hypothetical protein